jgi:hypothetical protein
MLILTINNNSPSPTSMAQKVIVHLPQGQRHVRLKNERDTNHKGEQYTVNSEYVDLNRNGQYDRGDYLISTFDYDNGSQEVGIHFWGGDNSVAFNQESPSESVITSFAHHGETCNQGLCHLDHADKGTDVVPADIADYLVSERAEHGYPAKTILSH